MTPIERVSEKSRAFAILGVSRECTKSDIKSAYHQLAREKHPDQGHGSSEEFSRITGAYQFLNKHADDLGISNESKSESTRVARPALKPSETLFSSDVINECVSHLDDSIDVAQHVSTQLHRTGRKLTYFVPTPFKKGANMVVVPTGELIDTRNAHPKMLVLDSRDLSGAVYEVPAAVCAEIFPGARSVHIRFAG